MSSEPPSLARRALAEGIGTFALVFVGCGAIVTDAERGGALGVVGVGLAFFLVLLAAIASLGHVSGAHFNPGVSLSFFLTRHLPGRDLGAYVAVQLAGAVAAALLLLVIWPGHPADLGATTPSIAAGRALLVEVVLTAFLMLVIISVATDTRAVGSRPRSRSPRSPPARSQEPRSTPPARSARARRGPMARLLAVRRRPADRRPARRLHIPAPARRAPRPAACWQGCALMATALFVCLHNAGRSQMSQALFERAAAGRHTALSAGTTPGERVHPEVVEVMRELDIDLSDRKPQRLTRELAEQADVIVTMGCGDECPYIPGKRYIDWDLEDPKGRPVEEVRATRDDIARRVGELVGELEASTP